MHIFSEVEHDRCNIDVGSVLIPTTEAQYSRSPQLYDPWTNRKVITSIPLKDIFKDYNPGITQRPI